MWSLGLIQDATQNASSEVPWFNATLLAAIVTAAATFMIGQFSAWQNRKRVERDRKQAEQDRRIALMWAFYAEATEIRNQLRPLVQKITKHGTESPVPFLKLTSRTPPMLVYKENAKYLGEIGDSSLVQYIVTLYSRLEGTIEGDRLLGEAQDSSSEEYRRLLTSQRMDQVVVFGTALYMSEYISELLQNPAHAQNPFKTSQEDRKRFESDKEILTCAQGLLGQQLTSSRANGELPSDDEQRSE